MKVTFLNAQVKQKYLFCVCLFVPVSCCGPARDADAILMQVPPPLGEVATADLLK